MAKLDHVSLGVTDLDAAAGFYAVAFDFEILFRDEQGAALEVLTGVSGVSCALAQLRHPGDGAVIELVAFHVPAGLEDAGPFRAGHGHVAFRVADLDAAAAELEALGAQPLGESVIFTTGRALYLREPGGSVLELYEPNEGN